MLIVIWEYHVKIVHLADFERVYAPNGAWAELFRKGKGYLGTELIRDVQDPHRFLTIDRWTSAEEYNEFLSNWQSEYKVLDAQCEDWTENESLLGRWWSQG